MIRVLIADDHAIVRNGLKQLCEAMGDITVAGEASNGDKVLEALQHGQFDLLLLDLTMPGVNGVELVELIHARQANLPILVFTMRNESLFAKRVLNAGASGYITKECEQDILIFAIRKIAAGGRFVDPAIVEQMMFDQPAEGEAAPREHLSERELQIMKCLAQGMSLQEVAKRLSISAKTVSTYKARLMHKMHFKSSAELVLYAAEYGLLD